MQKIFCDGRLGGGWQLISTVMRESFPVFFFFVFFCILATSHDFDIADKSF